MADLKENQVINDIRKSLGLIRVEAVLGDADGNLWDTTQPGFVLVRYQTSTGNGWPQAVRKPRLPTPYVVGTPVWVGYDAEGELCVIEPRISAQLSSGVNPITNDILNSPVSDIDMRNALYLRCQPTYPTSMFVSLKSWIYITSGATVNYYPGNEGIDLSSYVPGSGLQCLVGVFLDTSTNTEVIATSTPITASSTTPLGISDVQECVTAAGSTCVPSAFWRLRDTTTFIDDSCLYLDLRQWLNVAEAGGGGTGTVTSVGLSMPAEFSVSGSPVTTSGTLSVSKANQSANQVYAGPTTGSPAAPTFRALDDADIPTALAGHTITGGSINNTPIGGTTPNSGYFSALRLIIGGFKAIFTHANTADRTYTLPDATGTLALTSDIPAAAITQLTGDVTAGPGSGSQAATVAQVGGATAANVAKAAAALSDKFILQQPDATNLPNAQAMSALATGLVKNTTTTGVQSIATAGTDYTTPTGTENFSNKTITASSLVATALSLLIGGFKAIFSHSNTADRTYTFPDKTGTVALTSDVQASQAFSRMASFMGF